MPAVFVFGTLKKGFPLHEEGLRGSVFLGKYRTREPFPMFIAGPWYAPMMLNKPGTGLLVRGELYEVSDATLVRLDALESVGRPGNFRTSVAVEPLTLGDPRPAYAYTKSAEIAVPVHSGYLEDYQDRRFIPPSRRPTGNPRH